LKTAQKITTKSLKTGNTKAEEIADFLFTILYETKIMESRGEGGKVGQELLFSRQKELCNS